MGGSFMPLLERWVARKIEQFLIAMVILITGIAIGAVLQPAAAHDLPLGNEPVLEYGLTQLREGQLIQGAAPQTPAEAQFVADHAEIIREVKRLKRGSGIATPQNSFGCGEKCTRCGKVHLACAS